ncbi:MAG: hypothetical protein J6D31_09060 [Clostridia bacterium]|nr:hypothetical protein [Clostridia bacterium]
MKKACMRIVLFLLLLQLVWLPVQAAVSVQPIGMIDSILPDELPGSSTAPRDGQESTQPGRAGQGSRDAAEQGAPTPIGEGFSVGMAVLVVGLAVISLVVALLYVFRGQSRRHD